MMLKDAYEKYRSKGFIMLRTVKHKKFSKQEGAYSERENEEFDEKATGYAAIVPPGIIILDKDSYKDDGESFNNFLSDMGYTESDIVAFAKTPSGGEHYAFLNPYPTKMIGAKNGKDKRYPNLDIFSGYQSVIPCVGTVALNKHNELASYTWADDNFEEDIILNPWNEKFLELFEMRERGESLANGYDDLSLAEKENDMPDNEVVFMIERIPNETLDYDGVYLPIAMALYDRYEGGDRGLELFQQFCAKVEDNDQELNAKKWRNGNFKSSQISYKRLRKMYKTMYFSHQIKTAKSEKDLTNLISEMKAIEKFMVDDIDLRKEYAVKINSKYKELKKNGAPIARVPHVSAILKESTPEPTRSEAEAPAKTKLYLCDGKYFVQHGVDLFENIPMNVIGKYLRSFGYGKEDIETMTDNVVAVRDIRRVPDYMIKEDVVFRLEDRGGNAPDLSQRYNPLSNIELFEEDDEILQDFLNDIWAGKIDDIVKLVALTIKFGERKLNRLMLVAPSNSGKSEIFKHMGFQKITMPRLLAGMRGDKGVGIQVIDGIRRSGLLLIDEANDALPSDVKDMDESLQLDQFQKGGTQILRLHFTGLTSTHKTATSYNSDELYNRFLQVELKRDEMRHTIMESELFLKDSETYTKVVRSYMLRTFNEWMHSNATADDLRELQARYRLPVNETFSETLMQISEEVIDIYRNGASHDGDILLQAGAYYIKKKSDLKNQIKQLLEQVHKTSSIDIGKYTERMYEHFLADSDGKSIRVGDKVPKYYRLNLTPYYEDKEQEIINDFDIIDDGL